MANSASTEKYYLIFFSTAVTGVTLALTGYAALVSNSVTLRADFLKCFVEFLAIAIAFAVVEKTRRSDLSRYNYGFGKLEQLSSIVVALTMFCSAVICAYSAIDRALEPELIRNGTFGLTLSFLSVLGNGYMWRRFHKLVETSPSPVTESQCALFYSKMLASLVVSLSVALSYLAPYFSLFIYLDSIGSTCIALFLLDASFTIANDSVGDLVDRSVEEAFQLVVLKYLVQYEGAYSGFHGVKSRRVGTKRLIQINLALGDDIPLKELRPKLAALKGQIEGEIPESEVVISLVV
ncbi:MAG: cation diffusion facilitator family transporter [Bdellovibrionales bacterium]|nr:cation diffusion facilitator family transporter [Bdellovibrionales bacterium]